MPIFGGGQSAIGTGIVISLYDSFSDNADKIAGKFKTLEGLSENAAQTIESSLNSMKLGFSGMLVGAAIAAPLILATSAAMDFDQGMAKINTTAQLSRENLALLRDDLISLGSNSVGDINKIPASFEKIISQTNDVALSMDILKTATKGAQAGFADTDLVAGALAQTLSAVGKENTNAAEVMDTLFAAKRVGAGEMGDFATALPTLINSSSLLRINFKEVAGLFGYMTGKGNDAARSTMLLQNAFAALSKPEVTKELGKIVPIFDKMGMLRPTVDIFKDLNTELGKMSTEDAMKFLYNSGLRDQQATQAFAALAGDTGKLQEALDATMNPAGELAKALEYGMNDTQKFELAMNKLKGGLLQVGTVFLPVATFAAQALGFAFGVLNSIATFLAHNPVGQFILKLVGFVALLTFGIGAAIVAINLKKFAVGQLAQSLIALGKTELATTFLTEGMAAGFMAATAAIVPLLIEMLPFIAIGMAIVGVVYLISESMNAYKDVLDGVTKPASGFLGVMQKIGGVLSAVGEVWSSATSEGFSLSEKTAQALENLGIYEFVLNLATWVVRVKEFFAGVGDVVFGVFDILKTVVSAIVGVFTDVVSSLGINIDKLGGSMELFRTIGEAVALFLVGKMIIAVAAATYNFIVMAITAIPAAISAFVTLLAGMVPLVIETFYLVAAWILLEGAMLLIPIAIIAIIAAVIYMWNHWDEFMAWIDGKLQQLGSWFSDVGESISSAWSDISASIIDAFSEVWGYVVSFIEWYFSLPGMFLEWGVSVVESIYNGIISSWDWLKGELISLIGDLPGGSVILDMFGVTGGNNAANVSMDSGGSGMALSPMAIATGQNKTMPYSIGGNTETYSNTETKEVIRDINLIIDGKPLKARMDKIDKEQNSRK